MTGRCRKEAGERKILVPFRRIIKLELGDCKIVEAG